MIERSIQRKAAVVVLFAFLLSLCGPANQRVYGQTEQKKLQIFPLPQRVQYANERFSLEKISSIQVQASAGVPIRFRRHLKDRVQSMGVQSVIYDGELEVQLLNLTHPKDKAVLDSLGLSRASHPSFGQGYLLDMKTLPNKVVIAGDDRRGVWYGLHTFLQVLSRAQKFPSIPRVTIQDHPEIDVRGVHVQGYDKGYGAGNRWTVQDLVHKVPELIDDAARARLTFVRLHFEAGWINEVDQRLGVDLDEIMNELIEYGKEKMVDLMVEVEYSGLPGKSGATQAIDKLYAALEPEGRGASVNEWREPLCPLEDRRYYLQAVRRALSWKPWALDVSFNDHARIECPTSQEVYGTGDITFHGEALADLANEVEVLREEQAPGTRLYFLPRFYGGIHWERHPGVLSSFLSEVPETLTMITTANARHDSLQAMREKYDLEFMSWVNTTSNHAKGMKTWFPVFEFRTGTRVDRTQGLQGQPGSKVIFNLGAPPEPSALSAMMAGAWTWNDYSRKSAAMLEKAAERLYGREAAPLVRKYGELITWPVVRNSIGRNIRDRLKDSKELSADMKRWKDNREQAVQAVEVAEQFAELLPDQEKHSVAIPMLLSAKRIQYDYELALRLGGVLQNGTTENIKRLKQHLSTFRAFMREEYYAVPNDVKNAEVRARGLRQLQDYAMNLIESTKP